jgi:Domain of unknown function (DUF4262)
MEEEIAEVVRAHGWFAASVSDHEPPFLYSIGLMQTCDHPELIVFGLDAQSAHALLSSLVRDIHGGRSFAQPGVDVVRVGEEDLRVGFRIVHPTQHPLYLGYAMGYCRYAGGLGDLRAVQVFWPDREEKLPFEAGCELDVFRLQPRLDIPLTPSEIRRLERLWE